ncbi:MAG: c-type cytochrome [Candidatus Thiodiazotropha sp. (ex Troendleina suluensis)]|nr:c-type cytochrome [Candidatus Thiodiazotropha sp. (ex Troendleina suluensis)]
MALQPLQPLPQEVVFDEDKARLGKRLFFDTLLSKNHTVACVTCHNPNHGGAEPREVSIGTGNQKGTLNAPTVYNSYYNFRQFWDGRALDLKDQAAGPLHNPIEMAMTAEEVEQRLNNHAEYPLLFSRVYHQSRVRFEDVTDAIAEFEKALFTPDSRFDRYLRGEIELTADENEGYLLFRTMGCITCHNGINLGGNSYQYIGAVNPLEKDVEGGDLYARTGDPFDHNRFKVPTLRNIELTSPYLHDGSILTLGETLTTIAFHNLGFNLTPEENRQLTAFLKTLTGKQPAILESSP